AVVDRYSCGIAALFHAVGVPASVRARAFNGATGGCPLIGQRIIVRIRSRGFESDAVTRAGKDLGGISSNGDCRRMVGRRRRRIAAKMQHDSGRGTQIVLLVVATVSEFGEEILSLEDANADMLVEVRIDTTAKSGSEGIFRECAVEER